MYSLLAPGPRRRKRTVAIALPNGDAIIAEADDDAIGAGALFERDEDGAYRLRKLRLHDESIEVAPTGARRKN